MLSYCAKRVYLLFRDKQLIADLEQDVLHRIHQQNLIEKTHGVSHGVEILLILAMGPGSDDGDSVLFLLS